MIEEILKQGEESFGVKADINAVDNVNFMTHTVEKRTPSL